MREVLEEIVTHADGVDAVDAGRDPALHEAVLDQHRAPQQPDGAQVRSRSARRGVCGGRRGGAAQRRTVSAWPGESLDRMLARLEPLFFDPDVDPIVTSKTPGPGTRHPAGRARTTSTAASAMADLEAFVEEYPLNSRLVKRDGALVEEVYRVGGRYDGYIRAIVGSPAGGRPVRDAGDGRGAERAHPLLSHGCGIGPDRLRHRLGPGSQFARRHHQRVRRGLHGPSRHEGGLGGARLLRQPAEDGGHSQAGGRRAMVRGPHAVGRSLQESRASAASRPMPSTS